MGVTGVMALYFNGLANHTTFVAGVTGVMDIAVCCVMLQNESSIDG